MRRFLGLLVLVVLFASATHAESIRNPSGAYVTPMFAQYTGGSAIRYSGVQVANRNTRKTVIFVGYSTNGTDTLATLPGTATLQCSPTISGPWVTAKDAAANAVSATTSTMFNLDGYCQYYRASWTKTGTGKRSLSTWIFYGE